LKVGRDKELEGGGSRPSVDLVLYKESLPLRCRRDYFGHVVVVSAAGIKGRGHWRTGIVVRRGHDDCDALATGARSPDTLAWQALQSAAQVDVKGLSRG
jgi:hypothetical protein